MADKCKDCGKILKHNEVGISRKFLGHCITEYSCIPCLAKYLRVDEAYLEKHIEFFKSQGCTLFV